MLQRLHKGSVQKENSLQCLVNKTYCVKGECDSVGPMHYAIFGKIQPELANSHSMLTESSMVIVTAEGDISVSSAP